MKGYKDEKGKFHPIKQTKGVRKSRDQKEKTIGLRIRKARENFAELLRNNLQSFNDHHSLKLEYGTDGGTSKGLKFAGTNSFIVGAMTREQALDCVMVLNRYLNEIGVRKKRGDELQPFVKKNIAETLTDLDLSLRDLREESRRKKSMNKPTGQIESEIMILGGARNAIFSLLEQVPESLHKEIVRQAEIDRREMMG